MRQAVGVSGHSLSVPCAGVGPADQECTAPAAWSIPHWRRPAWQTASYPTAVLVLGFLVALSSLCLLFGGGGRDVLTVCGATVLLYGANWRLAGHGLNKILSNTISMFLAGTLAQGFVHIGFCQNFGAVIISLAFMLIPGIPLTNSVRNLLCGNEMNGILELFKVVLETLTIVLGLVLSIFLFGGGNV